MLRANTIRVHGIAIILTPWTMQYDKYDNELHSIQINNVNEVWC